MNILSFNPIIKSNKNNVFHNNRNINPVYSNLAPLKADTVSFGASSNAIHDAIESDYEAQIPMLKEKGLKLMNTMSEVAEEVDGCIYDTEYCEKSLNKDIDRYMKKFKDSGSVPMDKIRTTVFIKNLYDLSITENLLRSLEKRGYYVLPVPDKISGKKILSYKPDFDIRLDDISPAELKKLPQDLRECLSHRQKSGYGDIQMRIVDASNIPPKERTVKKLASLVPQEVILVFGRNTADAKTDESKYVYNITRALEKMHIIVNGQETQSVRKIKNHIKTISSTLRANISKPLYRNAENLDTFPADEVELEKVSLDNDRCKIISGYMQELRALVPKYYSKEIQKVRSHDYDIELEKLIKASYEYKVRPNKRISDEEIEMKRVELLQQLNEYKKEDMETLKKQSKNLSATIEKYGPEGSSTSKK